MADPLEEHPGAYSEKVPSWPSLEVREQDRLLVTARLCGKVVVWNGECLTMATDPAAKPPR